MNARNESTLPTLPGRLRALLGDRLEREIYLSTEEAAQLTSRPTREAFIKFARRAKIPLRRPNGARRGSLVVKLSDITWVLREQNNPKEARR